MRTIPCCWISVFLNLISVSWISGTNAATANDDYLPPPTNLTFRMDTVFVLHWEWSMPGGFLPCPNDTLQFWSEVVADPTKSPRQERKRDMYYSVDSYKLNLNYKINFQVRAICIDSNRSSKWLKTSVLLAPGNPSTSVRNVNCLWYNKEYVNCTWQPGLNVPPSVNYYSLYWLNDESSESEGNASENTQFENFLDTGKPCQYYIYNDGVPLGCHVKFDKQPSPNSEFMMVVTDRSKTIRPFIKHLELSEIYTPPPPRISSASRTHSQSINISWEISHNVKKLEPTTFQVEVNRTDGENLSTMEWSGHFKEVLNVLPDVGYTVRVRVKQKYGRWSEWSKEETLPGKESFGTTYMVLLLLIPLVITVSTIVLLIYLKRLKVIVFPPVPDPGKVFKNRFGDPNDWQQWIKYNKVNTSIKPAKEEICSVILVETPLSSTQVE